MKKLIALILCLTLCLSAFTLPTSAEEEPETFSSGDYKYIKLLNGTAEITKYSGKAKELEIPSALDGIPVTSIGDSAFCERNSLTSVTIPDSLTSVGVNPFWGCQKLTKILVSPDHPALAVIDGVLFSKADRRLVCYPCAFSASTYQIPQGILSIGERALSWCESLTSVTIPDSVTSIGDDAFYWCESLMSVTIPDGVTSIGDDVFYWCESLTSVTIPDSVTSIGDDAFYCCMSLTSVTIPDSVTSIGDGAFYGCKNLTSVTIPDSVASIGERAFAGCNSLTSVTIPDSVTSIGERAFASCNSLTSVTIPDSVTSVGDGAFYGCKSLASVTIPDSVTSIGEEAFDDCPNLTLVVNRNSCAASYCKDHNLLYTFPDSNDWLNG